MNTIIEPLVPLQKMAIESALKRSNMTYYEAYRNSLGDRPFVRLDKLPYTNAVTMIEYFNSLKRWWW